MKKIKFMIMTLAIAFSIGGAFATTPRLPQDCLGATQYYLNGGSYVLAGRMGIDYICNTPSSAVCTYYKVGSTYTPCCWGNYCTSNCMTSKPAPKKARN
ncbi:DUF6520 family protein [Flavitalea sp. BT771]|uniref:DUF6520 family protein n=1 Tax=Flavitalea sp. BT771 TaxID=3063329 RepID=UPI0026E177AC|nr:DUF6520 family protein [Flavitalea sp. BT771]MDO6432277.1 DUF6520 family protein [Flavitalea sp. BT771]MDV6221187.1 DUF6520 family protein [Flavitalea sp. BT771]